jgi:hypothetical protein
VRWVDGPARWVRSYIDRDGDVWDLYESGRITHAPTYSAWSADQWDYICETFGPMTTEVTISRPVTEDDHPERILERCRR